MEEVQPDLSKVSSNGLGTLDAKMALQSAMELFYIELANG